MKTCCICQETLPKTYDFFHKNGSGGFAYACKKCVLKKAKEKRESNYAKIKAMEEARQKRYRESGLFRTDAVRERTRRNSQARLSRMSDEQLQKEKEKKNKKISEWQKNNKDKRKEITRRWLDKNRKDPIFIASSRARNAVRNAIYRMGYTKKSATESILGCSFDVFKRHIEMQFEKGMTWENRSLWHIDHIIPVCAARTEEDVFMLNNYTNLRPIWAEENRKKSGKALFLL